MLRRIVHWLGNLSRLLRVEESAMYVYYAFRPFHARVARDDMCTSLVIAATLAKDSNAIDAGAHSGEILETIVRCAPDGRHIAAEPLPALADNLATRFPQVDVRPIALSDRAGEEVFTHVVNNPQMSGLRDRRLEGQTVEEFTVQLQRIDDIVAPDQPISLIKIDVEGAEYSVIEGARETIIRDRPTLIFEHTAGGADHFGVSPGKLHDLVVEELGMRIYDITGEGPYDRARFESVFEDPLWVFVARP